MKNPNFTAGQKVLQISAPNVSLTEGNHKAKIVDDNFIIKAVKTKKGEPLELIKVKQLL